jgi:flagellar biogenesis protein FliO
MSILKSLALFSLIFFSTMGFASVSLKKIEVLNGNLIQFSFDQNIRQDQISVEFFQDEVRITLDGTTVHPAKIIPVRHGGPVSQVFAYQFNPNMVQCRLSIKGNAENYRQRLELKPQGNRLALKFFELNQAQSSSQTFQGQKGSELSVLNPVASQGKNEEQSPEKISATQHQGEKDIEERIVNSLQGVSADSQLNTGNSAVVVEQASYKPLPSLTSVMLKLVFVSALIIAAAALVRVLKGIRMDPNNRLLKSLQGITHGALKQEGPSIEILGSHSIGPKKSLVTVRVVQKVLLLGVTEQSIHMISELPSESNSLNSLESTDASFEETLNVQSETGIRSRIRSRLEGLKPL